MDRQPLDPTIAEYIRVSRQRYTREAITARLQRDGHSREAIDAAWERIAAEEPLAGPPGADLSLYVWIVYWLGAAAIGVITVIAVNPLGSGGGFGFLAFGIGWLIAYLGLGFFPARAFARSRPLSGSGALMLIVGVPFIFLFIGGGICLATLAAIAASLGGGFSQ
jgi:hypothetical protein